MSANDRVRLVDLSRQLRPLMRDLEKAACQVIRSGWFLFGKETERFEKAFASWLGIECVVSCANGTDAITLALESLGIGEGDKVVTVPNTAFPTACAITRAGATPVFVDIDAETWLMRIQCLLKIQRHPKIGRHQKVVVEADVLLKLLKTKRNPS